MSRQITAGSARVHAGMVKCLYMGNIDSLRDWGHARDYVKMVWRILQQEAPEDFAIATGRTESVRRFIEITADRLDRDVIRWEGESEDEVGKCSSGGAVVRIDTHYCFPAEVKISMSDTIKSMEHPSWSPTTILEELVAKMLPADERESGKEAYFRYKILMVVESSPNDFVKPTLVLGYGEAKE